MSWFNSLTFTEEEIEVRRGEIALPRSQCWRGAKQGCKPKFLDSNVASLFDSLTCYLGSLAFLVWTAAQPVCR